MEYFSQRHGLRTLSDQTDKISQPVYEKLFVLCKIQIPYLTIDFFEDNPFKDMVEFYKQTSLRDKEVREYLLDEIPELFIDFSGEIAIPKPYDSFNQYALLDYVELIANNLGSPLSQIGINNVESKHIFTKFQSDVNKIFKRAKILYKLTDDKIIERIEPFGVLNQIDATSIESIDEAVLKKLLNQAIELYKAPNPESRQLAVDVLWKTFERLKSYYYPETNNKKHLSADMLIIKMSNEQEKFIQIFKKEFKDLADIGNNLIIRHSETDKTEITDPRHYDYFFNRCLSLIALAIQYLK